MLNENACILKIETLIKAVREIYRDVCSFQLYYVWDEPSYEVKWKGIFLPNGRDVLDVTTNREPSVVISRCAVFEENQHRMSSNLMT